MTLKKFLPFLLLVFLLGVWLAYLVFAPGAEKQDLSTLAQGQMSGFVVFENPKELPSTPIFDRKGEQQTLRDFEGKVTLVNFWATWCEPCREEMPTLLNLSGEFKGEDFQVVTVSVDWQGFEVIDPFLKEYDVTPLTVYWDKSNKLPVELEVIGLPLTILINKDGKWIGRMDGPAEWDSLDAISLMRAAAEN